MAALQPSAPVGASSLASAAAAEQQLQVQLLSPNAKAPTKGSAFAAGHDLYSAVETVIPARGRALVATDIKISVPDGTCTYSFAHINHGGGYCRHHANHCPTDGRVAPRSGLAYKHGIDTLAGVIDADYRGPVGVILANLSENDFPVKIGDRIAQLIVERVVMPSVVVVDQLEDTVRGAGGFGSTGGFGAAATVATQAAETATEAAEVAEVAADSVKA